MDQERRYEFRNKTANSAEITLYGPIGEDFFGEGISAKRFTQELKGLGNVRNIDLHIDSPGGSVTDARVIYTRLVEHSAKITVKIDGYAASAASFIAMAGDDIQIAEGGFFMIHNARGISIGDAAEMEKTAALLRAVTDTIAQTYVARTAKSKKKIKDWMDAETWFNGSEAVSEGFADSLMANKQMVACSWPDQFRNLPKGLRPRAAKIATLKSRARTLLEKG